MRRYVRFKRSEDWDYVEPRPPMVSIDVLERDPGPVWTGLFDAAGERLYVTDEMDPIGFVRF